MSRFPSVALVCFTNPAFSAACDTGEADDRWEKKDPQGGGGRGAGSCDAINLWEIHPVTSIRPVKQEQ